MDLCFQVFCSFGHDVIAIIGKLAWVVQIHPATNPLLAHTRTALGQHAWRRGALAMRESDDASLSIVKATYGPADAEAKRPEALRYVTTQLRQQVHEQGGGCLVLVGRSFNGLFGDPSPDEAKLLTVHFVANGSRGCTVANEGSSVVIDARRSRAASSESGAAGARRRWDSLASGEAKANVESVLESRELVQHVLNFLPLLNRLSSMAVCRQWRDALRDSGLTDRFAVGVRDCPGVPCYLDMDVAFVAMVLGRSQGALCELSLGGYAPMTDAVLSGALACNPQLRRLDLGECVRLSAASLGDIGERCPALVWLSLKRLPGLTDACLARVARGCAQLEVLDVSDCDVLTDESCGELASLASLRVLYAKDVHLLSDDAARAIVLGCGPRLEVLSLWGVHRFLGTGFERCDRLASLNLCSCSAVDDAAVVGAVRGCPALLSLCLRECHLLTDAAVVALSSSLGRLEHLDLRYLPAISDRALAAVAAGLLHLRSLNLTHCSGVSPAGVADVCRLEQLTELLLAHGNYDDDAAQLIANAVAQRAMGIASLDLLDLRGNPRVTSKVRDILGETLGRSFKESQRRIFLHNPALS